MADFALHMRLLTEQEIRTITASLDLSMSMLADADAADDDLIATCELKHRVLGDLPLRAEAGR